MLAMTLAALFVVSGAQPEMFGWAPVESITSPPDEAGEVAWSTADMPVWSGWRPRVFDEQLIRALFGPSHQVAPDVRGWAFAHVDGPEFGLVLVPSGGDQVRPLCWEWGSLVGARAFRGMRITRLAGSAWLNALADFQREVRPSSD